MSMVPWTSGKLLVWNATCSDTYAPSNIGVAATGAGAVEEKSEQHKISKYSHLDSTYMFKFIKDLGRRLKAATNEAYS